MPYTKNPDRYPAPYHRLIQMIADGTFQPLQTTYPTPREAKAARHEILGFRAALKSRAAKSLDPRDERRYALSLKLMTILDEKTLTITIAGKPIPKWGEAMTLDMETFRDMTDDARTDEADVLAHQSELRKRLIVDLTRTTLMTEKTKLRDCPPIADTPVAALEWLIDHALLDNDPRWNDYLRELDKETIE